MRWQMASVLASEGITQLSATQATWSELAFFLRILSMASPGAAPYGFQAADFCSTNRSSLPGIIDFAFVKRTRTGQKISRSAEGDAVKRAPTTREANVRELENDYRAGAAIGGKTVEEVNWKR